MLGQGEGRARQNMDLFLHLLNSATLIAAIALMYGGVQRAIAGPILRHVALGLIFGAGASLSILQPLAVSQNVIVDARSLFLGFAGAFVGVFGAGIALAVAAATRLAIGVSQAAFIGIASMAITVMLGVAWAPLSGKLGLKGLKGLLLLGLLISVSLGTLIFQPMAADALPKHWLALLLLIYNVVGAVTLGEVILSDRRRARRERAAQQAADTDALTGLLNRRSLDSLFETEQRRTRSRGTVLHLIDIDHFKTINDRYGHAVGDRVLRSVAQTLRHATQEGDMILRLGGEEFAVLSGNSSEEEARASALRIVEHLRIELLLPGNIAVPVTSSVGAHYWQTTEMTFSEAYEAADAALYAAKEGGRNCAIFSSKSRSA